MEQNKHEMNDIFFMITWKNVKSMDTMKELTVIHTYRILLIMKCMVC